MQAPTAAAADGPTRKVSPTVDERLIQLLDIAANNPDILHFQTVLNSWLKSQFSCLETAFILLSKESGLWYCDVVGSQRIETEYFSTGDGTDGSVDESLFLHKDEISYTTMRPSLRLRLTELLKCRNGHSAAVLPTTSVSAVPQTATLMKLQAKEGGLIGALCVFHKDSSHVDYEMERIRQHAMLIGALLSLVINVEHQQRLTKQGEIFLEMAQNVFSSLRLDRLLNVLQYAKDDMSALVRSITKEAKTLAQAETCSLFLLDKENNELVAEVFERLGIAKPDVSSPVAAAAEQEQGYLQEIRLPLNAGIVGKVASTGIMMNVSDPYSHPLFYRKVDERTGFVTRNILCFPIKDNSGNLVGVAELCNKKSNGGGGFTKNDEHIAATFAVYCAISLSHCLLYRKLQNAIKRCHVASGMMIHPAQSEIPESEVGRLSLTDIPSPSSYHQDFGKFHFFARQITPEAKQLEACVTMFEDLGFIKRWRMRRRTLVRFLLMVQMGYRDVPYHNWSHAFAVTHFTYLTLKLPAVRHALTDLECLSLLVASLCHDIDHRGTTNSFQLQSKTPLAQLYSSEGSVLERHHCAQTVCLLNMENCNVLETLDSKDYQKAIDLIRDIILGTDLGTHLTIFPQTLKMIQTGYDKTNSEHHHLLLGLLMTSSDLCDQTKAWEQSKLIAANIYTEFFKQGDLEKLMGNKPVEMMDRDRAWIPKIQLDFLDTVALPLYKSLAEVFPESTSVYESIRRNRRCWAQLDVILSEDPSAPSGNTIDIMYNKELERKVLIAIRHQEHNNTTAAKS